MTDIEGAVKILKANGTVICPTDTVYGILAIATSREALDKVFKIKKRDRKKPVPVFVKDISSAKEIAEINEKKEKFLKKVWPGKITVILNSKKVLPKEFFGETIGLRIPDNKTVKTILEKVGEPLTGTSANISGLPATGKIQEVLNQITADYIIDKGDLKKSLPSTVVDFTSNNLKILRQGDFKI